MDINDFTKLYLKGKEESQKEMIHQRYCSWMVGMALGTVKYVSWKDYYEKASGKNIDRRPTNEIIAELERDFGRKLV